MFSVQNLEGSYDANAEKHASGQVMDSIFAVRAAGFDPNKDVLPGGKSPANDPKANAAAAAKPAAAAKAALAAKALGLDPKAVNGTNLIANISGGLDAATGKYAADDFSQSIAMLGLACTGNAVAPNATAGAQGDTDRRRRLGLRGCERRRHNGDRHPGAARQQHAEVRCSSDEGDRLPEDQHPD